MLTKNRMGEGLCCWDATDFALGLGGTFHVASGRMDFQPNLQEDNCGLQQS